MDIQPSDIQSYNNFTDEEWCFIRLSKYRDISNLVLLSPMVFIADVDCDTEFTKEEALDRIREVERYQNKDFRVYETYKGFRVFDVETTLNLGKRVEYIQSLTLLQELGSDPKYIQFCSFRKFYAARVTPKQDRPDELQVCDLVKIGATITRPEIMVTIKLHDSMCFDDLSWCDQWRSFNLTTETEVENTRDERFDYL
jgi:hypothetical protein